MRIKAILPLFVTIFIASGCGEASPSPNSLVRGSLLIVNASQYQLQELRMHRSNAYLDTENVLLKPMEIGSDYIFHGLGNWNVTVYREKFSQGPLIAISTGNHVAMESEKGQKLTVFDESFRLAPSEWLSENRVRTSSKSLSHDD